MNLKALKINYTVMLVFLITGNLYLCGRCFDTLLFAIRETKNVLLLEHSVILQGLYEKEYTMLYPLYCFVVLLLVSLVSACFYRKFLTQRVHMLLSFNIVAQAALFFIMLGIGSHSIAAQAVLLALELAYNVFLIVMLFREKPDFEKADA